MRARHNVLLTAPRIQQVGQFYHAEAVLLWNGNVVVTKGEIESYLQRLPTSRHTISAFDCQPVIGTRSHSFPTKLTLMLFSERSSAVSAFGECVWCRAVWRRRVQALFAAVCPHEPQRHAIRRAERRVPLCIRRAPEVSHMAALFLSFPFWFELERSPVSFVQKYYSSVSGKHNRTSKLHCVANSRQSQRQNWQTEAIEYENNKAKRDITL